MQNPQYALQLSKANYEIISVVQNPQSLGANIFSAISPNINWHNPTHCTSLKYPFQWAFQQVHLSATASDMGKHPQHINRSTLIGGKAIVTLGQWAS
jgi:hypothetical protein